MAEISHDTETLLLKLYNLKSQESTIITDILKRKNNIGEMIEQAKVSKEETEQERERLEKELSDFTSQKDFFFETFGGLKDSDFQALQEVGVTVSIETLVSKLTQESPKHEDSLRKKIEEAKVRIVDLFGKISEYGADQDTAEEELQRAEVDRQALASLVEQSLSGNESDSLSKQYIRSILANFDGFSEEEITELCKIILFPEDVLSEFDRTYEERKARREEIHTEAEEEKEPEEEKKKVVPEEEPTPMVVPAETPTKEEPVKIEVPVKEVVEQPPVEEPVEEEEEKHNDFPIDDIVALTSGGSDEKSKEKEVPADTSAIYGGAPIAPIEEPEEEVKVEGNTITFEVPETSTTNLYDSDAPSTVIDLNEVKTALQEDEHRAENTAEDYLTELGFQLDKFKKDDIDKIYDFLKDVDSSLIKNNFELLRSISADDVAYVYDNGYMFVTDPELSEKINYLRVKSISEKKIKSLLENAREGSVIKKNFATIKERVEAIERANESVTDENIDYFENDTALYEKNVGLVNNTFELDEKELRNFKQVLFSPYVANDMKVLKEYLLSIVKQDNGRYALNTLTQTPRDLVNGIDGIIEAGLEELIISNPEVLELNMNEVLGRIEYLNSKGIALYDEERERYNPDIIDYCSYVEKYGTESPIMRNVADTNKAIPALVGNEDFTSVLVDTLNSYYETPEINPEVTVDEAEKAKYNELLASFEKMLNASKVGNLTYKIDDVYVSRAKLERHIKLLLNALSKQGQQIDGVEKEIILTSLLYNLHGETEKLKKVVDNCLGFNEGVEVGGPRL